MRGITLARSELGFNTVNIRQWLTKPGMQPVDLDSSSFKSMVDMLLWELGQIGGHEHNAERCAALMKALATLLGALTFTEDDTFVKDASLWIGVEVYHQIMSFRDAAARDMK